MTTGIGSTSIAHGASYSEPAASTVASNAGFLSEGFSVATGVAFKANSIANRVEMASMNFSVLNAIAEFVSTAFRDFTVDAKHTVKDQGEAGHKP